ncbi:hypothetical protein OSB04_007028 [Centaurea solstitialis]|uniref:Myb/SANT-like domain-containing protein n=1 Tax=Centaurea solstitialis TaxID=347529 RepID=A0AA38TJ25_9ASTR|nr:hypothetical protein OSB04_007028 [Centaurea solstitialis]
MVFIELCMNEVTNGNRPGSHFNKIGWTNIEKNINDRTGKVFDKKQLKNKWDYMKKEWKLYDRLKRIESDIGWDPDRKTIVAPAEWWDEKIKGDKDLAKFRDRNLEIFQTHYEPLFRDSVVVGDKTRAPVECQNNINPTNEENNEGNGDSDEVSLGEDVEPLFPAGSSSKRKKLKNVAPNRSTKGKSSANTPWVDKLDNVIEAISSRSTQSFPPKIPHRRQKNAWTLLDSDTFGSSDDEEVNWVEEENIWLLSCAIAVKGIIIGHTLNNTCMPCRQSHLTLKFALVCRTSCRTGNILIREILNGHPKRCYEDFRLNIPVFKMLCSDLVTHYGLKPTHNLCVEESVGIFLMTLAHGCGNRLLQETFNRLGETIHRHFHKGLKVVLKLSADIIKPNANYNEVVPAHILNNPRYFPMFKDCIGAIDETHVKAFIHEHEQAKYIGRKGYATQNIMAVCDFNMCFIFAWAGWEGTSHDTRIFWEALRRNELKFPHPSGGLVYFFYNKYYAVDAEYPNTRGYLAPYKGTNIRYHIPDFRRGQTGAVRAPKEAKEKFNYHHSSLRNVIERTFGVWKARWAILKDMFGFTYETQVNIVLASMAIHNYIRMSGSRDEAFDKAQKESYDPRIDVDDEGSGSNNEAQDSTSLRPRSEDLYMSAVRDMIAGELINRSR